MAIEALQLHTPSQYLSKTGGTSGTMAQQISCISQRWYSSQKYSPTPRSLTLWESKLPLPLDPSQAHHQSPLYTSPAFTALLLTCAPAQPTVL